MGIVFSHFLEVPINTGVLIGMTIVFIYAVLGGMKGITYTGSAVLYYDIRVFSPRFIYFVDDDWLTYTADWAWWYFNWL